MPPGAHEIYPLWLLRECGRGFSVLWARHALHQESAAGSEMFAVCFSWMFPSSSSGVVLIFFLWISKIHTTENDEEWETRQTSNSTTFLMWEPLSDKPLCLRGFPLPRYKVWRWACEDPWRGWMRMEQWGEINLISSLNLGPETVAVPVQKSREFLPFFF